MYFVKVFTAVARLSGYVQEMYRRRTRDAYVSHRAVHNSPKTLVAGGEFRLQIPEKLILTGNANCVTELK